MAPGPEVGEVFVFFSKDVLEVRIFCSAVLLLFIEQKFALDTQKLQGKYIELQRSLHPDNFSQKSQTEQRYSEEQSALINKAYRTLQKPLTRSVYLLRGVELDEGTDSTVDPALLVKIMEVNEKLAETQCLNEVNAVGQEVQVTLKDLTERMNTALDKGDLESAREILIRMKYFANLEEKVKEKLRENFTCRICRIGFSTCRIGFSTCRIVCQYPACSVTLLRRIRFQYLPYRFQYLPYRFQYLPYRFQYLPYPFQYLPYLRFRTFRQYLPYPFSVLLPYPFQYLPYRFQYLPYRFQYLPYRFQYLPYLFQYLLYSFQYLPYLF
ncbi:Iron-sulfur cluster co-chaperone protein HscB, mitochondrial [Bagarius yarrelli]|uniref:Iron-sulfur cluster co-chaperone protein HscB, mitochondrial n=1 Tax=Bagarius yarrelli TaxID=175774 RepID=A0A556V4B0_BAGYA|nr:Iron-sulfur cluster co-chaperone protein HscB, mitochondrial [Bagarius yarrelli]